MTAMRWLGWALLAFPVVASAQAREFRTLLDGQIRYRAPYPWTIRDITQKSGADGVVLSYRTAADSGVYAAVLAVSAPITRAFEGITDSLLQALTPGPDAVRSSDTMPDSGTRVVLWRATSPEGRILILDRLARTRSAIVLARIVMPVTPPADPGAIPLRLQSIDDLLTTIYGGHALIFPAGAQLGLKVY